jgi:crotonobetainyl-CoA:carnitine CoA-transferase CaiB-like acyl-CoA transferase
VTTDPLADRLTEALAHPATDDAFDPHAALAEVLAGIGLRAADAGGRIDVVGADPVVPSTLRLGGAAGVALLAKSVSVAALHRARGGAGQDLSVDLRVTPHRLCPFYDRRWELLNGYPPGAPATAGTGFGFRFTRTRDGRWVMPLNPYPAMSVAAQRLLGVPDDKDAVARAVAGWDAHALEEAAVAAGVVCPVLRTTGELLAERHYAEGLRDLPLVEITRVGDAPPEPLGHHDDPLGGVRALGMGHVIAGAGVGRALALHGADVLNVWRPDEIEHDSTYTTANVGVRSSTVDPHSTDGRALLRGLLVESDVFYANRRPGALERIGLGWQEAVAARPGLVHATASLNGPRGPWADRVGFDQSAGSLVGMMGLEGGDGPPRLPPILVVNDYIVSWLLTAGVVEALRRRATEGGSWRVHVSLTRAALWVLSLGVFDRGYAHEIAGTGGEHAYLDPETFTADTPLGRYQGVTEQVRMSSTPGRYSPVLVPRGSSRPEWLPRARPHPRHTPAG